MKKTLLILLLFCFLLNNAFASVNFDYSVFKNNPTYEVEFDDMDDTGEISLVDGGVIIGTADEEGAVFGTLDIKAVDGYPPVIRLTLMYIGEDWAFTDDVIIKPADTRFTFEVNRETEVDGGKIYEMYTIAITDVSIGMLKDIIENNVSLVRYRLSGDRNVDGNLFFNVEAVTQLYNDYIAAGGLDNDFSALNIAYPCTVK